MTTERTVRADEAKGHYMSQLDRLIDAGAGNTANMITLRDFVQSSTDEDFWTENANPLEDLRVSFQRITKVLINKMKRG